MKMQEVMIESHSSVFSKLLQEADRYAASGWPVLILGETGVGKELIARRIHEKSIRRRHAFVPLNCGAIPAALFESELFGHERGAFSGAVTASRGIFKQATGGTVFLDEIGELESPLQTKLLRLLDRGEVRAVGSSRIENIDFRIVAATNVNLFRSVAAGEFRLDLLERLSVLTLSVPPLRERFEDLPSLAGFFLARTETRYEIEIFSALAQYHWPGNIRQLRNVLVRAALLAGKAILTPDLVQKVLDRERAQCAYLEAPATHDLLDRPLAEIEKKVILNRLDRCRGNRKKAAKELGIAKSTLHEKLRRWREPRPASRVARPALGFSDSD